MKESGYSKDYIWRVEKEIEWILKEAPTKKLSPRLKVKITRAFLRDGKTMMGHSLNTVVFAKLGGKIKSQPWVCFRIRMF